MLSPAEQVTVLLKEYDALRAEIIARISAQFTLIAVGAAVLGAFLSWSPKEPRMMVIALLSPVWWGLVLLLSRIGKRFVTLGRG